MAQGFCRFPCLSSAEVERRQVELHGVDTVPVSDGFSFCVDAMERLSNQTIGLSALDQPLCGECAGCEDRGLATWGRRPFPGVAQETWLPDSRRAPSSASVAWCGLRICESLLSGLRAALRRMPRQDPKPSSLAIVLSSLGVSIGTPWGCGRTPWGRWIAVKIARGWLCRMVIS